MNRIIARLGKPELEVRKKAVQKLMSFRKPTKILASKTPSVWDNTVWTLEEIARSSGNSPEGLKALNDIVLIGRDLHTDEAKRAIQRLGERSVPSLLKVLKSDPRDYEKPIEAAAAREFAATMLGRIRSQQATEALIEALQDESNAVRLAAAQALVRINPENPRVKEALVTLLEPRIAVLQGVFNCWVRLDSSRYIPNDTNPSNNISRKPLSIKVIPLEEATPEQITTISSRQEEEREVSQEDRQQAQARAALAELRQSQVGQRMRALKGTVDLQVTGFDYQPHQVIEGQPVKFTVSFKNAGTGDNTRHFMVACYYASPQPFTDRRDTRAIAGFQEMRWSKWLRRGEEKILTWEHAFTDIEQSRIRAAYELGEIGLDEALDQNAVQILCIATQDPSWVVRRNAVQALTKIGLMPGTSQKNRALIVETLQRSLRSFEDLALPVLQKQSQGVVSFLSLESLPTQNLMAWAEVLRQPKLQAYLKAKLSPYDWQIVRRILYGSHSYTQTDDIVRYYAAVGLGKLGFHQSLFSLIATLNDPVWSVRQAATRALGELHDEAAVDPIETGSLQSPNPQVRMAALRVLGQLGTPKARRILLEAACKDTAPEVRQDAVADLFREIPRQEVFPCLVRLAEEDPSAGVRAAATRLLAELAEVQAEKTFLKCIRDKDGDVREAAAWGLGRIASKAAVAALIAASQAEAGAYVGIPADVTPANPEQETPTDKDVRAAAVEALSNIGGTRAKAAIRDALNDKNWKVLQKAIAAVQKWGPRQAVPKVFSILSGAQAQKVFTLHAQAIRDALPVKKKEALSQALQTQKASAELRTVLKLPGIGTPPDPLPPHGDPRPDLQKFLSDKDWQVVQEAIAEMDTTARLIEVMKDEKALIPVRVAAAQALRAQKAEEAIEPMVDLLNHSSYQIKIAVSSALVEMGDKRGQKTLKEQLQSKELDVRREAAKTIATMDPQLIMAIKGLKPEQQNGLDMLFDDLFKEGRFVYTFTVQALEELGCYNQEMVRTATRQRLLQELKATHPLVRAAAVETLCRLGDTSHLDQILQRSDPQQEPHEFVRLKAIEGIAKLGASNVKRFLQQALNDPVPEVQAAASKALLKVGEFN